MTGTQAKWLIGWGLTILVALMPFHAFLVIALGHATGHEPIWAAWKEVLLVILTGLSTWLVAVDAAARARLRQPLVYVAASFVGVAALVTIIARPSLHASLLGAKSDLEFIVAAIIALTVADQTLLKRLVRVLLASTSFVVIFALLQATILPRNLLTHVGYIFATGQTAPYQTVIIGSTIHTRFGSTLGGPNQLGTFLILPFVLTLLFGLKRRIWWLASLAIIPALFVTYSRGAWVAVILAAAIAIITITPARARLVTAGVIGGLMVAVLAIGFLGPRDNLLANYLHHSGSDALGNNSDNQHASSLREGLHDLAAAPFGHGLGTAGPATFHGGTINILEDNYLQLGYETGVAGLILFIGLVVIACLSLISRPSMSAVATASAIIGISLTALVLPAWTDSSTALTVWTLAGANLGVKRV